MNVEKILLSERKSKNLTQLEVAKQIGISRAHYTNIEKGHRIPSPKIAKKLGAVLDIDWTVFYQNVS